MVTTSRRAKWPRALTWLPLLAALAAGCQWPNMPTTPSTPSTPPAPPRVHANDPCAERLGDLCSRLLLYYMKNRDLPARLEDLAGTGKGPLPPLSCPASGKPYGYAPDGIEVPGSEKRLVVYDREPAHAGTRWVIAAEPTRPGEPVVLQVLRMSPKIRVPTTPRAPQGAK